MNARPPSRPKLRGFATRRRASTSSGRARPSWRRELAGVDGRLRAGAPKRGLPLLDQVRVASPCKADWNEMLGDERVRFCLSCEKNVYNLSSMAKDDAEALLRERLGDELCVRFYQRADGTILTQDCPMGVKKKRRKKLALAVAGAGAMAAAAATMFTRRRAPQGAVAGAADVPGRTERRAGRPRLNGDPTPMQASRAAAGPTVTPTPTTDDGEPKASAAARRPTATRPTPRWASPT